MEKSLKECFGDLVYERAFIARRIILQNDPLWIKRNEIADQVYEEAKELCGQFLADEFREAMDATGAIEIEEAYKTGLRDGAEILRELRMDIYAQCILGGRDRNHAYEQFRTLSDEHKMLLADIMIDLFEEMEKHLELPDYIGIILGYAVSKLTKSESEKEKAGINADQE